MGLVLSFALVSCSEDSGKPVTPPEPPEFEITTLMLPAGHTCTPYSTELEASGGMRPYTWSVIAGNLPDGMTMTEEGRIWGVMDSPGEHTFTVQVMDNSSTPQMATMQYTWNVQEPANPSLAVFFDGEASICCSATEAWSMLDSYIFIMLDEGEGACAWATEFMLRLTDVEGVDLEAGTDFGIINVSYPQHVSLTMGEMFDGIAISFNRPMFGPTPIHVASFSLMLLEDVDQLSFKFDAYPGGYLAIAGCDEMKTIVEVDGREAAINY
jgi:hypothetical protein